jgi:hypothetical protein
LQESSVEKFGAVHTKVQEGDNEQETTRGASLRELERFFKEHDKDEGYAGLRRIADEDGTAVWTILKEMEVVAQLEKRAEERREEERRHEKIFSAQARTPSDATAAVALNVVESLQAELKASKEKVEAEAKARGVAEANAVRCPIVLEHPTIRPMLQFSVWGAYIYIVGYTHSGEAASQAGQGREHDERAEERRHSGSREGVHAQTIQ